MRFKTTMPYSFRRGTPAARRYPGLLEQRATAQMGQSIPEPRADVRQAPVLGTGARIGEMLHGRDETPLSREPDAHRPSLPEDRRTADGRPGRGGDERVGLPVVNGAAERALDEDARRDVDGPGHARIGIALPAPEVEGPAEVRTRDEVTREEVRCGERLGEKHFARKGTGAALGTPGILCGEAETELGEEA